MSDINESLFPSPYEPPMPTNCYTGCPTEGSITLASGEIALKICYPLVLNSTHPMGNPQTSPYDIESLLKNQISTFIPDKNKVNIIRKECDIIILPRKDAKYLLNTFPDLFQEYQS